MPPELKRKDEDVNSILYRINAGMRKTILIYMYVHLNVLYLCLFYSLNVIFYLFYSSFFIIRVNLRIQTGVYSDMSTMSKARGTNGLFVVFSTMTFLKNI